MRTSGCTIQNPNLSPKTSNYRRLTIADMSVNPVDYWVEGIGSANGDYISKYYIKPTNGYVEREPKLMTVYNADNELIFEYSDFATSEKIAEIEVDIEREAAEENSQRIYNISGRELFAIPTGQIYILNGQKFLNK